MKIIVVDTETSGLSDTDQVVEIATVEVWKAPPEWVQGKQWQTFVKPTCPVTPASRGIHHIKDEELNKAPSMEGLLLNGSPFPLIDNDKVMVGHNLDFDVKMLLQSGFPEKLLPKRRRICTYRCALHLFPNEDSHKVQSLRYALNLTVPETPGPPHRALPDAVVTASLLCKMLETHRVEDLIKLTTTPVILQKVPFGKYFGMQWEKMDTGFLQWVNGKEFNADVKYTVQYHMKLRSAA